MANGEIRGRACRATTAQIGLSPVPALIVELAGDELEPSESVSRLVAAGLERVASLSRMPGPVAGWMALARPGIDRIDVLSRSAALPACFGGPSIINEFWLESAARTGYCLLVIGFVRLDLLDEAADPVAVTRIVDSACAGGLVAVGKVSVLLPAYLPVLTTKPWPGRVIYGQSGSRRRASPAPLGFSVGLDETDEVSEAASVVRAEARGMSYEWVRQRLAVELLKRGHLLPPRIVDQVAAEIMLPSLAGKLLRSMRASKVSLVTGWLAVRSIVAFAMRRPIPHWHILGMHVMQTYAGAAVLEVDVDSRANELMEVGEGEEVDVWLGVAEESGSKSSEKCITVYRGDYRLGTLGGSPAYQAILTEPQHANIHILTDAIKHRADDGSWKLYILAPYLA